MRTSGARVPVSRISRIRSGSPRSCSSSAAARMRRSPRASTTRSKTAASRERRSRGVSDLASRRSSPARATPEQARTVDRRPRSRGRSVRSNAFGRRLEPPAASRSPTSSITRARWGPTTRAWATTCGSGSTWAALNSCATTGAWRRHSRWAVPSRRSPSSGGSCARWQDRAPDLWGWGRRSAPSPHSALDGLARPARVVHGRLALCAVDPEDVRLEGDAGVELDDLGERVTIRDPERLLESAEDGVVEVEEAVAVAQRLELSLPDRELELAELGPADVALGDHPDEGVEPVDVAVDRPAPPRAA